MEKIWWRPTLADHQAAEQGEMPAESHQHEEEEEGSAGSPELGQTMISEKKRDDDKKVEDTKQNFLKA